MHSGSSPILKFISRKRASTDSTTAAIVRIRSLVAIPTGREVDSLEADLVGYRDLVPANGVHKNQNLP